MDETRRLLDSLMGQSRDQSLEDAKESRGKNFMKEGVCKFYLLGFCPQYELAWGKMTKRNIGECDKTHSDAMKDEFDAHPDREKMGAEYEKNLLPVLESCVREADAWVARERANVQRTEATVRDQIAAGPKVPQAVQDELNQLNSDVGKLMAAAEEYAEEGDIDGSKFKVVLAEEIKAKVKELEEKHAMAPSMGPRAEEVCEVCGTRTEAATSTNHARYAAHFTGKVHVGYTKIRKWVKDLRRKMRDGDRPTHREGRVERSRSRDQRRARRSRSRRSRSRDRDKERGRREGRDEKDKAPEERGRREGRDEKEKAPEERGRREGRDEKEKEKAPMEKEREKESGEEAPPAAPRSEEERRPRSRGERRGDRRRSRSRSREDGRPGGEGPRGEGRRRSRSRSRRRSRSRGRRGR